jgi:NADH-quinone oxidoreductase subunit C
MNENEIAESADNNGNDEAPLDAMVRHINKIVDPVIVGSSVLSGEIELRIEPVDVPQVLAVLKADRQAAFNQMIDLTAVDYPERNARFEMVYLLLSMANNMRLRIVTSVTEGQTISSVTSIYMAANWAEREVWDMFGIFFSGHPDLRRLLTDYGFEGHPLRKDFPLTGHIEVRYDDAQRRVVNEPVHLVQEFRDFDFLSPWEGMQTQIAAHSQSNKSDKKG